MGSNWNSYINKRVRNVMHAYLIMAHKNQHQLIRLLKQLDDKDNDIYLNIDQKTADQFNPEIIKNSCSYSGVYFLKPRKIFWGGDNTSSLRISPSKNGI